LVSRPTVTEEPDIPSDAAVEVRRVIDAFADDWNRHDMVALAALFAADAEFVNVVGIWWRGRAEIQAAHELTHSNMFKSSRLRLLETQIRVPVEGIAIARSRWQLEGHFGPDGSALPPRTGVLLSVLQHKAGSWLIIDTQNTDIIEGAISRPQ
jgi:uncharacterized protein (TIGR02246 family)